MKKRYLNGSLPILLLALIMTGCFSYRELPVEYDYSYRGRFDKYNSYDFVAQKEHLNSNSGPVFELIHGAIESHMNFLGYKRRERKPDLLLTYSVFLDSLSFRGYQQPAIEEWMERPDRDLEYDQLKFNIPKGTLLIQVFDRKQNASIWQGYATDQYGQVNFTDERQVRNAVRSILNKYQFFADGFLEEKEKLMTQNP